VKDFFVWMKENLPQADINDSLNEAGYMYAKTLEQVLRQAGDDLTRENIMKQAASLKDFKLPLLLPGSTINTSATDYRVIKYMKLQRFNGKTWNFVE
jgi:branched-chain amino acid transport system substrate-binding protein